MCCRNILTNLFGVNQKYYDVFSQRKVNTKYINNTNSPIYMTVWAALNNSGDIKIIIDNVTVNLINTLPVVSDIYYDCSNASAIIPSGATYSVQVVDINTDKLLGWVELRATL